MLSEMVAWSQGKEDLYKECEALEASGFQMGVRESQGAGCATVIVKETEQQLQISEAIQYASEWPPISKLRFLLAWSQGKKDLHKACEANPGSSWLPYGRQRDSGARPCNRYCKGG